MRFRSISPVAWCVLLCIVEACGTATPTPAVGSPRPSPTAAGDQVAGPTALEACDPAGFISCDQQAAFISIPIADSGLSLTWSSQWSPMRSDHPDWNADALGLGGWSINVLQRYEQAGKVLLGGDGSWRFVDPVSLPSGGQAIPSYDGSVAYLFDSAGRETKQVDGRLGTTLLSFGYDQPGRLANVDGVVDGQPAHLTVKRGSDGTPTALVGMDGGSTALDLDSSGRLVAVRDPAGGTTSLTWTGNSLVGSETDPMGGTTRYVYDQAGRLSGRRIPTAWPSNGPTRRLRRPTR